MNIDELKRFEKELIKILLPNLIEDQYNIIIDLLEDTAVVSFESGKQAALLDLSTVCKN